ncbi:MAG: terminase small subunit [Schwartzia sp.]|nr:terminase small subunit [Schwartzia sp. (in: firmicutes)]
MRDGKLTVKQQRFVDEYLISGNASDAARRAGYSKRTANRVGPENLSKPVIRAAIEKALDEQRAKKQASFDEIMEFFTSVMRDEVSEEVVVVEGDGDGCSSARIMNKKASAHDRIDAAKFIGNLYMAVHKQKLESEAAGMETNLNITIRDKKDDDDGG